MDSEALIDEINRINRIHAIDDEWDGEETGNDPESAYVADISDSKRAADLKRKRRKPARKVRAAGTGSKRRDIIIYISEAVILLAAVGLVIGFILWNRSFTKIDLKDYTQVNVSGYNHFGSASVHVDVDPAYSDFWSTVSVEMDRDENLRNGDVITISYSYDDKAANDSKLRVEASDTQVTVEGLTEPNIIDHEKLYSGLNIIKDGLSPKISIQVENVSDDTFLSQIQYVLQSDKLFYADGDEISVKADVPRELLESHEYVLENRNTEDPWTVTIDEPSSYIMDASFITQPVLDELNSAGLKLLLNSDANEYGLRIFQQEAHIQAQFVGNKTTFKWNNAYLISAYFHSATDEGLQSMDNHANDVRLVYGVTITQQNGAGAFAEAIVQYTNLYTHPDGTLDLNLDSGRLVSCTYRDKNAKELVSGVDEASYNTVKLTQ